MGPSHEPARHDPPAPYREHFAGAARGLCELVAQIAPGDWTRPGLGEWDVRALVGHASRALSVISGYLSAEAVPAAPVFSTTLEYYLAFPASSPAERARFDAAIAERGRAAGAALGEHAASALDSLSSATLALVGDTPDDAPVVLSAGSMAFAAYLPTRTFELAVHGLDLATALGLEVPPALDPAVRASCELAGRIAAAGSSPASYLLLLTGRQAAVDFTPGVA